MEEHADLDVYLTWSKEADGFSVTMLYNAPGEFQDSPYFRDGPLQIPLDELAALKGDVEAYGRRLGELVFDQGGGDIIARASTAMETMPVDVRLLVDRSAPAAYQAIWWEAMRHPRSGERLTTKDNVRFSRYQEFRGGRQPTPLARQGDLRSLVVVANPEDIGDHAAGAGRLAAIDVQQEKERAGQSLSATHVTFLDEGGARATRRGIADELRKGYEVLYLVCHGRISDDGRPELFLEDDEGFTAIVRGEDLASDLSDLAQVPTIVVLCSCQSGGPTAQLLTSTAGSLTATGPAVAGAGAAVVLAMQGNVTMTTAATFLERFFRELDDDGLPAQAAAAARSAVSDRDDWFMPVLYSRLKRGSAWYRPRFGGREAKIFSRLWSRIAEDEVTPIVGSGVAGEDGILPSRQVIAERWAESKQMPLSVVSRNDLASVAQYVSVEDRGGYQLARGELAQLLRREMKAAHARDLPDLDWQREELHALMRAVAAKVREESDGADCYTRLAALDLPVYVTTSWGHLLEDALTERGREPVVRHFTWYRRRKYLDDLEDDEDAVFDEEHPLVYHLFGTLDEPRSLVLTEDDYFSWLREWIKQVDKGAGIPNYIKLPLVDNSLVFLGYEFDDWEFRMILYALKGFESDLLRGTTHVGVQLKPDTLRVEQAAAHEYLESYLGLDNLDVYWDTSRTFLADLAGREPRRG